MLYFIILIALFPLRLLWSHANPKNNKNLILQTAKIGDYINTTCLINPLIKENKVVDIVIDNSVKALASNDPRLGSVFIINSYRKNILMKLKLGFMLLSQRYDQVIVTLPNQLNLFLGSFCLPAYKASVLPYGIGVSSKVLTFGYDNLVSHSRNDLTIQSYSKCLRNFDGDFLPKSLILKSGVSFDNYFLTKKKKAGVALSSGSSWKNIPIDEWAWIFKSLSKLGFEIIVIGTGTDDQNLDKIIPDSQKRLINLVGLIPLENLPSLISTFTVVIGCDSAPVYIADALDVASVVYSGPCHMVEQRPVGNVLIVNPSTEPERKSYIFDTIKHGDYRECYTTNERIRRHIINFLTVL